MASKELSAEVKTELCNLNIDTNEELKSFRRLPRARLNDMITVLSGISTSVGEVFVSRKRVRHDALKLFNEGELSNCP